jgi:prepilin-type processing-associated H-X9-DG protein
MIFKSSRRVPIPMTRQLKRPFTLTEAIILILIFSFSVIFFFLYVKTKREEARRISCMNNIKNTILSMRMYTTVYDNYYPDKSGRSGLQMLADEGFLENTSLYVCPSTNDIVPTLGQISQAASYAYAGGYKPTFPSSIGIESDRSENHNRYGNIGFADGHVKGYSGSKWSSNCGSSFLGDFK